MTETPYEQTPELAEPKTQRAFPISAIWLLPLIAMLIGGWLVYQTIDKKGPLITITFQTGEGLEAEKTKLKFRDVEIGLVKTVTINEDYSGVVVTAEINKESARFLTDTARFWIIRPRLGVTGISGLSTLISGAYIEIDPGNGKQSLDTFTGLEIPPVVASTSPGREFILTTNRLGSYNRGSPVYYRGLNVGEVLGYEMSESGQEIFVHVFIHAPHFHHVRENSRFWDISGIEVAMDTRGMKVTAESLQTMIVGGIGFDSPADLFDAAPSAAGSTFVLYENEEAIEESQFVLSFPWILYFDGSVHGLNVGAPVEMKGIKIGEVKDVRLEIDPVKKTNRIPVYIVLEPQRVSLVNRNPNEDISEKMHRDLINSFIQQGLRARLKTSNLLTGALLVDVGFHPNTMAKYQSVSDVIPEIPTIPSSIEEITGSVTALLNKIEGLPLEELTASLTNTVKSVEKLVSRDEIPSALRSFEATLASLNNVISNIDTKLAPQAQSTLIETQKTLQTVRDALASDSPLRYDLETTLQELAAASRSIRLLAEFLESNPNALIYGKGKSPTQ